MRSLLIPQLFLMVCLLSGCVSDATTASTAAPSSASSNNEKTFDGGPQKLDTVTPVSTLYMDAAKRAEHEGNAKLAAVLYRAAAMANEKDIAPRQASAELFEKAGEYNSAAAVFTQLAKETGNDDYTLAAARNALKLGDLKSARAGYESVLAKNPADWRGYNGLAVISDMNENHAAAADNYALAYDKAPQGSKHDVTMNWALSLMLDNKANDAITKLEALDDAKENPKVKTRLALAYAMAGRTEDAKRLGLTKIPTEAEIQHALKRAAPADADHVTVPPKP